MAAATRPPFKADVVGSLLRPREIFEAREKRERGAIGAAELRAVEDRCVRDAVALQKDAGLRVATDGEFHRRHWFMDFIERIDGVAFKGGLPTRFRNEGGEIEFSPPRIEVAGRLGRSRGLATDDFRFLKSVTDPLGLTAKQPIPSPTILHFRGGRAAIDRKAYPELGAFFADLARVYREELSALYDLGCRYVQIDETNLPYLCDPKLRAGARERGEDPDKLPALYVGLLNDVVRDRPKDMTVCLHMCRGNHESSWVAEGGYDPVSEVVFGELDIDGFFLEYDSPRAGSFAPLRYLSGRKIAVLGLVTTKKGGLENKDEIKRRIDEAARIVPLDRLALSPQCGFASTIGGNKLTVEEEKAKLRLVVDVAREVWGNA
jgi:5-methyltetrahydropteroyltriglutamate--homocysteine methyltransferase